MYWFVIGSYLLYVIFKMYANILEIAHVNAKKEEKAVILSPENYLKAAAYKIASQKFSIVSSLYDALLFILWVSFGLTWLESLVMFESVTLSSVVFMLSFIAINFLLSLPFDLYQTFALDKAFGFSTIDVKTYCIDLLKSTLLFVLFGGAFFAIMSLIIEQFSAWWVYGFGFAFAVILFINMIYPSVIVPLFNKLTPLEDSALRESIEALLTKAGLKSNGVFCMDASKRDNRLNAYFGGLGSAKRVVLFDTLIAKLGTSELLAVLGHELGHFSHKDIVKNIGASGLMLFIMFAFFGNLPESMMALIGIKAMPYSVMTLFLLLSPLISFVMMPFFGLMSRYNEYRADEYGSACESKEALASALMKLADENKSFPYAHPLTIALYFTHPPLTARLEKLGVNVFEENL